MHLLTRGELPSFSSKMWRSIIGDRESQCSSSNFQVLGTESPNVRRSLFSDENRNAIHAGLITFMDEQDDTVSQRVIDHLGSRADALEDSRM